MQGMADGHTFSAGSLEEQRQLGGQLEREKLYESATGSRGRRSATCKFAYAPQQKIERTVPSHTRRKERGMKGR